MAISGKTRVLGVWGYPVSHSLSPAMHNAALASLGLDWIYVPFAVEPGNIPIAVKSIRALDLVGVNVTVPLKESIAPLLDWVDPVASRIKSVNTIVNKDGELRGYSTDGQGLLWDLSDKSSLPSAGSSVLVLGAGGSARAVVDSLHIAGYKVRIANRTLRRALRLVEELNVAADVVEWNKRDVSEAAESSDLIVNTTTLGMLSTDVEELSVLSAGCIGAGTVLYDLVYSPPNTPLMSFARDNGAVSYNGLGMLVRQGALSLSYWSGVPADELPVKTMEVAIQNVLGQC